MKSNKDPFLPTKPRKSLLLQIVFTVLAFVMMVVLSYLFMSNIVHRELVHNAENELTLAQAKIDATLHEAEVFLGGFSQTIRHMILNGSDTDMLQDYISEIFEFILASNLNITYIDGIFGYFETLSGERAFINGKGWIPPEGYRPQRRNWYEVAISAGGSIAITPPYVGLASGNNIFTFARSIYDNNGRLLGVVALNLPVDIIGDDVVATALAQGGYGMLISQYLIILAHPNEHFVGRHVSDPDIPISRFVEELERGLEITGRPMISFRDEASVAFFRTLQNGWHLALVTPRGPYYHNVTRMALTLCLLGAVLAGALIFVLVHIDAAKRKSDEESRQKSVFLANMSHEMRTPLNAVIGLSELTLQSGKLSEDVNLNLSRIYNAGMTLLSTVNDILDISKIEAGKLGLIPVAYDVPSLINDSVTQSITRIESKPINFVLEINEEMPASLYGDDLRIKQILNNLLSNAFKYTKAGTVGLNLSFERDDDDVWLIAKVSDTGMGIRSRDIEKLFLNYSQMDTKFNRKIEGTGLGLPITKKLAELMGGSISVESEYGKGSVFTVRVKQKFIAAEAIGKKTVESLKKFHYSDSKRDQNSRIRRAKLPYAKVLIVDDVQTNLDVAKGMMKPYGMQIDCVTSGKEAIDAVRDGKIRYNAIFMDHMMPGMDGMEAARIIREEIGTEYAKNVPIIALTANAIVGTERMFLDNGFQAFLSKPIEIARLDSVIREWVRDKELEKKIEQDDEPALETHDGQNLLALSAEITGLDFNGGLKRFSGDVESYIKVLHSYAENTRPLLEQMKNVNMENLSGYAIVIHGIKGSSRGICAMELGDRAEALEKAAKEGKIDYVMENNKALIEKAEKLIGDLDLMLAQPAFQNKKPKKEKPDNGMLESLLKACDTYNMDMVDAVMAEIESYEYESDDGLVAWLKENVDNMNFLQIKERLSAISNTGEKNGKHSQQDNTG